jgi:hypothetical protein
MPDDILYMLLDIAINNKDVSSLLRCGISFKHIAELTDGAIKSKHLTYVSGKVKATKMGRKVYEELQNTFKKTDKNTWIEPLEQFRIEQMKKDGIYLPSREEVESLQLY